MSKLALSSLWETSPRPGRSAASPLPPPRGQRPHRRPPPAMRTRRLLQPRHPGRGVTGTVGTSATPTPDVRPQDSPSPSTMAPRPRHWRCPTHPTNAAIVPHPLSTAAHPWRRATNETRAVAPLRACETPTHRPLRDVVDRSEARRSSNRQLDPPTCSFTVTRLTQVDRSNLFMQVRWFMTLRGGPNAPQ